MVCLSLTTCPQILLHFCLAGSNPGLRNGQVSTNPLDPADPSNLQSSLDQEVLTYRASAFAPTTFRTYSAHQSAYLQFCRDMGIRPVPISQLDLGRYIAFLSRRLTFSSVRQYLNAVRLMHLEAGHSNPLDNNWYVTSILKVLKGQKELVSVKSFPLQLTF